MGVSFPEEANSPWWPCLAGVLRLRKCLIRVLFSKVRHWSPSKLRTAVVHRPTVRFFTQCGGALLKRNEHFKKKLHNNQLMWQFDTATVTKIAPAKFHLKEPHVLSCLPTFISPHSRGILGHALTNYVRCRQYMLRSSLALRILSNCATHVIIGRRLDWHDK